LIVLVNILNFKIKKMKNIKILALIMAVGVMFTSCNPEKEINLNDSERTPSDVGFQVDTTSFGLNPTTSDEADVTYTYSVVLSNPQTVDVIVPVTFISGDATVDEDFEFDSSVRIPAGATSANGTFTVLGDILPEATETFTLSVGSSTSVPNVNGAARTIICTIDNYTGTELRISCAWDKEVVIDDVTYNMSDIDYDFYVTDSSFNVVAAAETGSHPEEIVVDGLADGIYYVFSYNYDSPYDFGTAVKVPIRTSFTKPGIFVNEEVIQPEVDAQYTADSSSFSVLTTFAVSGGIYTINDSAGNAVVTGRMSAFNFSSRR
jgi:hypothetical protein